MLINHFFTLSRLHKQIISIAYDVMMLSLAFLIASSLRYGSINFTLIEENYLLIGLVIILSIITFIRLGLYHAVLRCAGSHVVISLLLGISVPIMFLLIVDFYIQPSIDRSALIIDWFISLVVISIPRWFMRYMYVYKYDKKRQPVIVFGAGEVGQQLINTLQEACHYNVVALIDDDPKKHKTVINGIMVHLMADLSHLIKKYSVKKFLLAIGLTNRLARKKILEQLEKYSIEILTIPSMSDIVSGKAKISDLQEVDVDDLLGRDVVPPNQQLLTRCITNKVVMVTGAGGSIGAELCQQIYVQKPKSLILFERNEFALYSLEQRLQDLKKRINSAVSIYSYLGCVQNQALLTQLMSYHKVNTVYHTAAYKHVPLVEFNIIEAIKNNVFGTLSAVQASIEAKIGTFVLVSTDKAVRPTNFMGASKRLAELILQAKSHLTNHGVCFCMVRFGNVLNSTGSVVPLFREQIKSGGPVTVTHSEITRFFMSITEAAQLVIQAGAIGKGGEVFVLDMGQPVKILDLVTRMIRLSGLTISSKEQAGDIEIVYSGLRPGEKLYEELLIGENIIGGTHPKIMAAQEKYLDWPVMSDLLEKLQYACNVRDYEAINELILSAPVDFNPQHKMKDRLSIIKPNIMAIKNKSQELECV